MKPFLMYAAPMLLAYPAHAQTLSERYEAKMKAAFVGFTPWERSLEKAQEKARASGQLILGYFTRSYQP